MASAQCVSSRRTPLAAVRLARHRRAAAPPFRRNSPTQAMVRACEGVVLLLHVRVWREDSPLRWIPSHPTLCRASHPEQDHPNATPTSILEEVRCRQGRLTLCGGAALRVETKVGGAVHTQPTLVWTTWVHAGHATRPRFTLATQHVYL